MVLNCWGGMKQALYLMRLAKLPRRYGYACPWCKSEPPMGNYWVCGNCKTAFDTFESHATCPNCAAQFPTTRLHGLRPHVIP